MKNFLKNKKGEGSYSTVLITWIILIASLLILLYFITLIDYSKSIDEQMCHLSVLSRGASGEIKGAIPFSCKTSKLCVTRDGSCEETGREKQKVSSKEEVYELLANKMADCWWMFGEGKSNFIDNKVESKDLYCALCYDIIFDDSLASIPGLSGDDNGKNVMMLSRLEFYRYLEKHEVSENKTYSQYMKLPSAADLEHNFMDSFEYEGNDVGVKLDLLDARLPKIDLNQRQYIFMGAFNRMSNLQSAMTGSLKGGVASTTAVVVVISLIKFGAFGAAIAAAPISGGTSLMLFAGAAAGPIIGGGVELARASIIDSKDLTNKNFISAIAEGESGDYYLTPTIVSAELNEDGYNEIQALGCKAITTSSGG